jgi:uncharacterized protein (TIGR02271 family)
MAEQWPEGGNARQASDAGDGTSDATPRRVDDEDRDDTGFMASVRHFFAELFGDAEHDHAGNYAEAVRRGGAVLTVEADQSRIEEARDALNGAGAIDIDERVSAWRSQGWSGHDADAAPYSREQAASERENVLPVVKEELAVGKRQVSGGAVRVVSRVVSRPVSESVELRREEAVVERRPVDREASETDRAAVEERTVEVQEMAERPVVQKTAHVVEEVVVGKRVSTETQKVEDTVRSTEVNVERIGGAGSERSTGGSVAGAVGGGASSGRRSFADVDDEFRRDYQTNFAKTGASYDELQPAYRCGYELRDDSRFADRDWDEVEPELRSRWEREHPGSTWERVKAAVRHGWERVTS